MLPFVGGGERERKKEKKKKEKVQKLFSVLPAQWNTAGILKSLFLPP
jgi:hypothetical protein